MSDPCCATDSSATTLEAPTPSVLEAVRRRLHESPYCFQRSVSCNFADGVVTLHGRVPSYYLKQTAQTLALQIAGVSRVVNHVAVTNPAGA